MQRAEASLGGGSVTRIAVLNSHPIQYFAPLYAFLNTAPGLEVTALYLSDFSIRGGRDSGFGQNVKWDLELLNGYRSVFLRRLIEDQGVRQQQGRASLARILQWSYRQCLEGIRSALAGSHCRGAEAKSMLRTI
jgi:hypothetical protein